MSRAQRDDDIASRAKGLVALGSGVAGIFGALLSLLFEFRYLALEVLAYIPKLGGVMLAQVDFAAIVEFFGSVAFGAGVTLAGAILIKGVVDLIKLFYLRRRQEHRLRNLALTRISVHLSDGTLKELSIDLTKRNSVKDSLSELASAVRKKKVS